MQDKNQSMTIFEDAKWVLKNKGIECKKYNYALD